MLRILLTKYCFDTNFSSKPNSNTVNLVGSDGYNSGKKKGGNGGYTVPLTTFQIVKNAGGGGGVGRPASHGRATACLRWWEPPLTGI